MDGFNSNVVEVNKCVILNKTVQHLLSDVLKFIKEEMTHLTEQECELRSSCSLTNVPEGYLRRPFLKLRSGECPPLNVDAAARQQRKEYNLSEVRALCLKNLLKSEWMSLIKSVGRCALEKKIEKLDSKREALLSKLSALSISHAVATDESEVIQKRKSITSEVLNDLRETENLLLQFRSMHEAPSQWLTSAMADAALSRGSASRRTDLTRCKSMWEKRIYRRYHGAKFKREYTAQTWVSLLAEAEQHLTAAEWSEVSIHTFENSVSPRNLQLFWHHRVRPSLNTTAWTAEEDENLKLLVDRFGQHGRWEEIAGALNTGRTPFSCIRRWQVALNPEFKLNRAWSVEEDTALMDILKRLLELYPPSLIDWDVVEAFHTTRTASECRLRAPVICSAFPCSSVTSDTSELPVAPRAQPANSSNRLRSFSAAEDLQLLMAVQRYGNASGRMGGGSGVGMGSWAVICSALPGRSVCACRNRYYELCVQFQPWTYSEDRRLYGLVLQGVNYDSQADLTPFLRLTRYRNLLPQFPGRSLNALRQRCLVLIRWSRVWKSLRQMVASVSEEGEKPIVDSSTIHGSNSSPGKHAIPREFARLLGRIPCTMKPVQLVTLRKLGQLSRKRTPTFPLPIIHSTGRLFGITSLTTWTTREPQSTTTDSEFAQLLADLSSGLLIPRPLIFHGTQPTRAVQPSTDEDSSPQPQEGVKQISLLDAKKLVNYTQIKRLLAGPVRRSLFCLVIRANKIPAAKRSQWMKRMKDAHVSVLLVHHLVDSYRSIPASRERVSLAKKLLENDQLFWLALDHALKTPSTSVLLQQTRKVADLHFLAPSIARCMIRIEEGSPSAKHLKQLMETKTPASMKTPKSTTEQAGSPSSSSRLDQGLTCEDKLAFSKITQRIDGSISSDQVPLFRRVKLFHIKRLLHMYGRRRRIRGNAYALASTRWTNKATALTDVNRLNRPDHYAPPILQYLPPKFSTRVFFNPTIISEHCLGAAQGCIRHGLNIKEVCNSFSNEFADVAGTQSIPGPSSAAAVKMTPDKSLAKMLPPSYSTLFAFKSLILRLPQILQKGGHYASQMASIREILQNRLPPGNECDNPAETSIDSDLTESLSTYDASILPVVQSDAHRRFLAVGLSILLWPTLLSTLSASSVVQSGKRFWEEALAQLPEDIVSHVPRGVPARESLMVESEDDSIPDDPLLVLQESSVETHRHRKRKRPKPMQAWQIATKRMRISRRAYMLKSSTVSFKLSSNDVLFYLTLPADVKRLFASGFRPDSLLCKPK
ncbi:Myb-like DNA-binding domain protein [Opisthorchis viverrini]|uniref:Myb-like DNA-binding domain protein n=1 Tax=Opisthorchis viverrini TaxID=6198 RepID=A0A1S8WUD6_OPIVI|nr:Myb-like DNA-binding domain protein [Opisthorchis viverrini]